MTAAEAAFLAGALFGGLALVFAILGGIAELVVWLGWWRDV